MKTVVSACLLGENCKYSGGNNYCPAVVKYLEGKEVLPLCPEMLAGLGCPRTPVEICGDRVLDREGRDVTQAITAGVAKAMEMLQREEIEEAVLQSRSPTCGVHQVYDGSFTGKLIPGSGLFAQALLAKGCRVLDKQDIAP